MLRVFAFISAVFISSLAHADVDQQSHYFGRVQVNTMSSVVYQITNTGETPLTFNEATISGIGFSAEHTCEDGLKPHEKCMARITYWPPFAGMHTGRFVLDFVEDSTIVIDLWGEGVAVFP